MPATATGRGAQVVVDPLSNTAKAIRGVYAATLQTAVNTNRLLQTPIPQPAAPNA